MLISSVTSVIYFIIRLVSSVDVLGVKASDWIMPYYKHCECALKRTSSLHSFCSSCNTLLLEHLANGDELGVRLLIG